MRRVIFYAEGKMVRDWSNSVVDSAKRAINSKFSGFAIVKEAPEGYNGPMSYSYYMVDGNEYMGIGKKDLMLECGF